MLVCCVVFKTVRKVLLLTNDVLQVAPLSRNSVVHMHVALTAITTKGMTVYLGILC